MIEINKATIITAGIVGTIFLGYCIYYDYSRRRDPEYKKKVRERRRNRQNDTTVKTSRANLSDQEIERYFLQEIQLGETEIAQGDFESGVEHLANAIVVCGQPARLLQVLQASLPAQVFAMLIQKMQVFGTEGLRVTTAGARVTSIPAEGEPDPVAIDELE